MAKSGDLIQFFHKQLPVRGDASVVRFDNGDYKFWEVRDRHGRFINVMREMVGVVSLQERLDYFLRAESGGGQGYTTIFADHIVPAGEEIVKRWEQSHFEQMVDYRNVFQIAAEMALHVHKRGAIKIIPPSVIGELAILKAQGINIHLDDIIDAFLKAWRAYC